jgi:hypothetical protein
LDLQCDELYSSFPHKFNLRSYIESLRTIFDRAGHTSENNFVLIIDTNHPGSETWPKSMMGRDLHCLVHFSAQPEPLVSLTLHEPTQRTPQKVLMLSRKVGECKPLMMGINILYDVATLDRMVRDTCSNIHVRQGLPIVPLFSSWRCLCLQRGARPQRSLGL